MSARVKEACEDLGNAGMYLFMHPQWALVTVLMIIRQASSDDLTWYRLLILKRMGTEWDV
jgi:hypothetical protein